MRSAKSGLSRQTFPGSEGRRMFFDVARRYGGHKVKAVIRLVAKDLGISFDVALRMRKGRIGARAFPQCWSAYRHWIEQRSGHELEALRARIERLEQNSVVVEDAAGERRVEPSHARQGAHFAQPSHRTRTP